MRTTKLLMILLISILVASCGPKVEPFEGVDLELMRKSIKTPSGLRYIEEVVGFGARPKLGQTVVVHYVGKFPNGKVFDSSIARNKPFEFDLGSDRIIQGWNEGLLTMRVGGERTLIIPPDLAYGNRGVGGVIPARATLIFTISLLKIID